MAKQIVVSGNRVLAHGEDCFNAFGNGVVCTDNARIYENATAVNVDYIPADIDSVGYEYHAGEFVPCAPFGEGDNNGYFMEVCTSCATPRSSGIPVAEFFKKPSMVLLWENASLNSIFKPQTITLSSDDYDLLCIVWARDFAGTSTTPKDKNVTFIGKQDAIDENNGAKYGGQMLHIDSDGLSYRKVQASGNSVAITTLYARYWGHIDSEYTEGSSKSIVPLQIYGVKL